MGRKRTREILTYRKMRCRQKADTQSRRDKGKVTKSVPERERETENKTQREKYETRRGRGKKEEGKHWRQTWR